VFELIFVSHAPNSRLVGEARVLGSLVLKRIVDLIGSFAGLLILTPVFVAIAIVIKVSDGGPIFYRGIRVGRAGQPFRIFKFRTMFAGAEQSGPSSTAGNDPRITEVGRLLRHFKLDELPQLLNVAAGQMSLVGPRPQVEWAVALYTSEQLALLEVRPGLTDFASIVFANEAELLLDSRDPDHDYLEKIAPEKIRLGLEYVHNRSTLLDLRIIVATLCLVLGLPWHRIIRIPRITEGDGRRVDTHA
jgi:lipopolysaccharide/colanic/teichoic acid biosynthesis glycosyltransferase